MSVEGRGRKRILLAERPWGFAEVGVVAIEGRRYRFGVSGGQSSEVEVRVGEGRRAEVGGRCWGMEEEEKKKTA
jgi:hypothetical protein